MKGTCLCGAVGWEADESKWCGHCHCTMCQRAHGAAFVTWLGLEEDHATVTDPEDQLGWHQSSTEGRRGFCRRCGSMLFFQSSQWPGELHVTRASAVGDVDREPAGHAFYGTHVSWVTLGDTLPGKDKT